MYTEGIALHASHFPTYLHEHWRILAGAECVDIFYKIAPTRSTPVYLFIVLLYPVPNVLNSLLPDQFHS